MYSRAREEKQVHETLEERPRVHLQSEWNQMHASVWLKRGMLP